MPVGVHARVGRAGLLQEARGAAGGPQEAEQRRKAICQEAPGGGVLRRGLQL